MKRLSVILIISTILATAFSGCCAFHDRCGDRYGDHYGERHGGRR